MIRVCVFFLFFLTIRVQQSVENCELIFFFLSHEYEELSVAMYNFIHEMDA